MTESGKDTARAFVARLRKRLLHTLEEDLAREPKRWVIYDFPSQLNCGDSAIWMGELAAAQALGARVIRAIDRRNHQRASVDEDALVLLHGGGNFGGLYATHERVRNHVLRAYRGRRVVQLPQSIEYADAKTRESLKRAVAEHGNLLLYVRDERSYERATADLDCEVRLVPDAAYALGLLASPDPVRHGPVVQRRTDKEAAVADDDAALQTFDWLRAPWWEPRRVLLALARASFQASTVGGSRPFGVETLMAETLARSNVRCAQRRLSAGRPLVTDRLHGHILATLMGLDHCVVNDKNGKVAAFWNTWSHEAPGAHFASTWEDARQWLVTRVDA